MEIFLFRTGKTVLGFLDFYKCVCVCVCVCVWTWGCMVGYEEREVIILDKLENLNHAVNVEDSQNFLVHVVLFYRKLLL